MDNIIVAAVVGAAGIWCGLRLLRRRKGNACASGCAGCGATGSPKPLPLVQIRR
jgi:hypothetical protein